jgi:hypothetical protein
VPRRSFPTAARPYGRHVLVTKEGARPLAESPT